MERIKTNEHGETRTQTEMKNTMRSKFLESIANAMLRFRISATTRQSAAHISLALKQLGQGRAVSTRQYYYQDLVMRVFYVL